MKHIEIPLQFTVIYFSDLAMVTYAVYVYSGNTLMPNPIMVPMVNSALIYVILKTVAFMSMVAFINLTKYISKNQYEYSGYITSAVTIIYTLATMSTIPGLHDQWTNHLFGNVNISPEFYEHATLSSDSPAIRGNITIK